MKELKIGKLIFNKTAITLLVCCLFFNGLVIGFSAAYAKDINILLFYLMILLPYLFLYKKIKKNIREIK